jgi:hypothetical protein
VARDYDIDVPGGLSQPVERRLVGAKLIVLAIHLAHAREVLGWPNKEGSGRTG